MTPIEQAKAAHAGKVKPEDLTGAAKYLYRNMQADELKQYETGEPPMPKNDKAARRSTLVPIRFRAAKG